MLGFIFSLRFSLMCRTIKGIMNKNFKLYLPSRPRRLRRSAAILDLCAENRICPKDLILPVFIQEGLKGSKEIPSMPNIHRHTIDSLLHYCEAALKADIKAIAPFPMVDAADKSLDAREAFNPMSLANRAIAAVKRRFPEMLVVADAALDPYTSHGHDGILDDTGTWIINDQTVAILCQMAVSAAEAGADVIAPSDMMDGRIGAIRSALDDADLENTAIMAYSAKYASAFYGPFRDAIGSAPKGKKGAKKYLDKRGYQLNPANASEALKESRMDEDEGADILMVKPALPYLDILAKVKASTDLPVAAYQVSGEYSMIAASALKGWLDYAKVRDETLLCIKRAGADMILTYFAQDFFQKPLV